MAMLRATQRLIALCSPRAAQASGERAGWGAIYPAARHACKGQIETTCGGEMLHRVHGKRVPRSTIAMYLRSADAAGGAAGGFASFANSPNFLITSVAEKSVFANFGRFDGISPDFDRIKCAGMSASTCSQPLHLSLDRNLL
ncbi:hypothetical protein B0H14DRAFT_2555895 [Mycena olivaceomarginata]|nr:hypothetical protein B0H14DRAFT_2555895 [Mycena olivaceomarginata]